MSLFVIADVHLSFGADKPMDVFKGWENYTVNLEKSWRRLVKAEDTVVIAGDISWAMKLEDTIADFTFLQNLPGRKILLKGNHDYWWSTKAKMDKFLVDHGFHTLSVLHNCTFETEDYALCGSRGWFYDAEQDADKRILLREAGRLRMSIEAAMKTGKEPIAFLHYPPIYNNMECPEILNVLREYPIKRCFYGHIHGGNAARYAFNGERYGIQFRLVACDHVHFTPLLVEKSV